MFLSIWLFKPFCGNTFFRHTKLFDCHNFLHFQCSTVYDFMFFKFKFSISCCVPHVGNCRLREGWLITGSGKGSSVTIRILVFSNDSVT